MLSIILKLNKIYMSSNTTILYFINLNNDDQFRARPDDGLPRPKLVANI